MHYLDQYFDQLTIANPVIHVDMSLQCSLFICLYTYTFLPPRTFLTHDRLNTVCPSYVQTMLRNLCFQDHRLSHIVGRQ